MNFLSSPTDPGFFREYVNLPVANLLPIPNEIDLVQATMFEPFSVIMHSMRFVALQPGETAVVMGAGPIGALTIAALKLAGAKRIWCFDPQPHRREMGKAMGADEAFDPFAVDPVKTIQAETHKRGADVSVDCAGRGDSVNQCLEMTRGAGRVVITGIPMEMRYPLNFHALRRKEISFFSVRRSNHTSETALDLMKERPGYFSQLITHVRPLDSIQRSFEILENYEEGVGKIVLTT
jgi:L-iditol 2-dehydrogenase